MSVGSQPDRNLHFVVTAGTPAQLFAVLRTPGGLEIAEVGDFGADPRRVRFLDRIAVVTHHAANAITILVADTVGDVDVVGTASVGDGPATVDLRRRQGGGVAVLTCSEVGNTVTVIEIADDGTVLATTTTALPPGATGPVDALWLHDGFGT